MASIEVFSEIPLNEYYAGLEDRLDGASLITDSNIRQMNLILFDTPEAYTFPFRPKHAALRSDGGAVDLTIEIVDKDLNPYPNGALRGTIEADNLWIPNDKVSVCRCGRERFIKEGYMRDFWGGLLSELLARAEANA